MHRVHENVEGHLGLDVVVGLRDLVLHPGGLGRLCEARAPQDQLTQLWDGDPLGWVAFKYPAKNTNHLRGKREDGLEKEWILQVLPECGILH
jgi:hypothetical protein